MNVEHLYALAEQFDLAFLIIGLAIFAIEIAKSLFTRSLSRTSFFDMLSSVSTQIPFLVVEVLLMSSIYVGFVLADQHWVTWSIPTNVATLITILVLADLAYYCEHRTAHMVRLLWTQHAVHHSSRFMNISAAIRFGPFESLASAVFYFPLVLIGFPAEIVLASLIVVLAYQTWLHTELVGRLGVLEGFLNTPSNHRVHHGANDKYLDKNFGGILIIWDRLFGTYQAEEETPRYGLRRDFNSVNPLKVWVSELPGLWSDLNRAVSLRDVGSCLFGRPGKYRPEDVERIAGARQS